MTPEKKRPTNPPADPEVTLEKILATRLGEPSPVEGYYRRLGTEACEQVEAQLLDVQRAQAAAAARLPNLYAG